MARHIGKAIVIATLVLLPLQLLAQDNDLGRRDTTKATPLTELTVTATRTPKPVFRTANPVVVVDSNRLRSSLVNGIAEILREYPGLDLTGTGANQGRPVIRGQRGQRILLLEDGIRLNNSRRQQDFGELPALVGLDGLSRVEVVRGPLSVLYGTDAIGGVVNLISARPTYGGHGTRFQGNLGYRYSTSDAQQRPTGRVFGQVGGLGFGVSASYRDAHAYQAPAGHFGDITLANDTKVMDTGVRDGNYALEAGYGFGGRHAISAKYSRYSADDAGFGFVENAALGTPDAASVKIRYPEQRYDKVSLTYRGNGLNLPVADRFELTGYTSGNRRSLTLGVFVPFGPGTPPGAGVQVDTRNFTDIGTIGYRAEATKVLGRHVFTYGMDFFRDRSDNTDSSTTTVIGFGPPQSEVNDTALTPNASFRSAGLFVQGDLALTNRLSAVLGVRWQDITARTRPTPQVTAALVSAHDNTVVGSANLSYRVVTGVNLVAAVGRGFRSPNLIERFFNGPTPEGSGYQARNPDLKPETSLDVDLGVKLGRGRFYGEAFVFRNEVKNGVRIAPTGQKVGPFDVFQNVNVDKLRDTGVELLAQLELLAGFSAGGSYTHLSSKNVLDPSNPVGDTFSSKVTGSLAWRERGGRFWAEYDLRHNGTRKDVELGSSPIGPVLPSFTVHGLRAGARLFKLGSTTHGITVALNNLSNALYAEFSNASFFRPEPKRSLGLAWTTSF
ncbi:MAG TPA: TonB-dependent receptor [Gemmatimonadales bacterium]|nr:TonB-dependent receptor [Gemmatimonadales bacterium]